MYTYIIQHISSLPQTRRGIPAGLRALVDILALRAHVYNTRTHARSLARSLASMLPSLTIPPWLRRHNDLLLLDSCGLLRLPNEEVELPAPSCHEVGEDGQGSRDEAEADGMSDGNRVTCTEKAWDNPSINR